MEDTHNLYRRQLDLLRVQISQHEGQKRIDLLKMWKNVDSQYRELDKEYVICRRKGKQTSHYQYIEEDLLSLIRALEKRITWANLL